ncbi:MAG TPA: class I SAM-dependent methyltransferase [Allosphingosinicella sp.]|jgi:cyclopropane fatty-acyl-phospholipid synthase-like methyltransferase
MNDDFDVPSNWYESFFTAPVNRFWETMVPPEATAADMAFVARHMPPPPARILDVPCGAGRHALAFARLGYEMTGVDLSEEAIGRASTAAADESLPARFQRADMRRFALEAPFDAAICLGNSLGYFGAEGLTAFLARLAASVRPGGRLVLDSHTCAESLLPLAEEREIAFEGGSYSARLSYDVMASVLKTEARLVLGDETHRLLYAHHVVTSGELVRMLATAGFAIEGMYADTEDAPYTVGSPRLLLVATRA